jgi:hypothetical protein
MNAPDDGPFPNDPGEPGANPCRHDHEHTTICRIFGHAPIHTPIRSTVGHKSTSQEKPS